MLALKSMLVLVALPMLSLSATRILTLNGNFSKELDQFVNLKQAPIDVDGLMIPLEYDTTDSENKKPDFYIMTTSLYKIKNTAPEFNETINLRLHSGFGYVAIVSSACRLCTNYDRCLLNGTQTHEFEIYKNEPTYVKHGLVGINSQALLVPGKNEPQSPSPPFTEKTPWYGVGNILYATKNHDFKKSVGIAGIGTNLHSGQETGDESTETKHFIKWLSESGVIQSKRMTYLIDHRENQKDKGKTPGPKIYFGIDPKTNKICDTSKFKPRTFFSTDDGPSFRITRAKLGGDTELSNVTGGDFVPLMTSYLSYDVLLVPKSVYDQLLQYYKVSQGCKDISGKILQVFLEGLDDPLVLEPKDIIKKDDEGCSLRAKWVPDSKSWGLGGPFKDAYCIVFDLADSKAHFGTWK